MLCLVIPELMRERRSLRRMFSFALSCCVKCGLMKIPGAWTLIRLAKMVAASHERVSLTSRGR